MFLKWHFREKKNAIFSSWIFEEKVIFLVCYFVKDLDILIFIWRKHKYEIWKKMWYFHHDFLKMHVWCSERYVSKKALCAEYEIWSKGDVFSVIFRKKNVTFLTWYFQENAVSSVIFWRKLDVFSDIIWKKNLTFLTCCFEENIMFLSDIFKTTWWF